MVGATGSDGNNGATGATGEQGHSAYQIAAAAGFLGAESEWLESLVGATGATGTQYTETSDITLNSLTLNDSGNGLTLAGSTAITGSATIGGAFTVAGDTTLSGITKLYNQYNIESTTFSPSKGDSGTLYTINITSSDQTFTLPDASDAAFPGVYYNILLTNTSSFTSNTLTINTHHITDPNINNRIDGLALDGTSALPSYNISAKGSTSASISTSSAQEFRMLIKIICFSQSSWVLDTTPIQNVTISYSGTHP